MISFSQYDVPTITNAQLASRFAEEEARRSARVAELAAAVLKDRRERKKNGQQRAVICIDTGRRFESSSKAAIWLGLTRNAICYAIDRGTRAGSFRWRFANRRAAAERKLSWKPVRLVYGDLVCGVWRSMKAAADANGINPNRVQRAVYRGTAIDDGRSWEFVRMKSNQRNP